MSRILYITNHNPWGIGGGSFASAMYLRAFCRLFKDDIIDLCVADNCNIIDNIEHINVIPVKGRSPLARGFSVFTGELNRFKKIGREMLKLKHYEYVILDHSSLGYLIKYINSNTKSIVIHHNFEPDYYRDNNKSFIMRSIFLPYVKKWEKTAYKHSDINLFLSDSDLIQFKNNYGNNHKINIVTGLVENDSSIPQSLTKISTDPLTIVITGVLDNVQNIDGIKYFVQELYPQIPQDIDIIIAGKNPSSEIKTTLSNLPNVKLIPNPKEMDPILRQGSIFLCPARLGSGIKVRISDGLKIGMPVIAHQTSIRGYEKFVQQNYMYPFSNAYEFKDALNVLIDSINGNKINPLEISRYYRKLTSENDFISNVVSIL